MLAAMLGISTVVFGVIAALQSQKLDEARGLIEELTSTAKAAGQHRDDAQHKLDQIQAILDGDEV